MAAQDGVLYHMVELGRWRDFQARQEDYIPPTYEQDGFIHLTSDPSLLLSVANHFYTSSQDSWAVLVIDRSKLSPEVIHQSKLCSRAGGRAGDRTPSSRVPYARGYDTWLHMRR